MGVALVELGLGSEDLGLALALGHGREGGRGIIVALVGAIPWLGLCLEDLRTGLWLRAGLEVLAWAVILAVELLLLRLLVLRLDIVLLLWDALLLDWGWWRGLVLLAAMTDQEESGQGNDNHGSNNTSNDASSR